MARRLPISGDAPHSFVRCLLDGQMFKLETRWNARASAWFLSIYDSGDVLLLANRRLVVGWPLTWRFKDTRLPLGDFVVVDTSGQGKEAGLTELGTRVFVAYIESAEVRAAAGL